ncbi:hypothetical protein BJY00DRAFT_274671 [Aspergillus carlsbadensis]|nr:hypothetical protein BJY00DRAFT_274671 [Aspergillus carlsbadensis]
MPLNQFVILLLLGRERRGGGDRECNWACPSLAAGFGRDARLRLHLEVGWPFRLSCAKIDGYRHRCKSTRVWRIFDMYLLLKPSRLASIGSCAPGSCRMLSCCVGVGI